MESSRAQLQRVYHEKELAMKSQQEQLQSYSAKKKEKEVVLSEIQKDKQTYAARITEVRRKQQIMQKKIESLIMAQQALIQKEQERARLEALRRQQRLAEARKRREAERRRKEAERQRVLAERRGEAPATKEPPPEKTLPPEKEPLPVVPDQTESEIDRVSVDFDQGESLPWPVNNGVVVRRFGSSLDKELNIVTVSNGIDISVPVGTPVKSVSGGKVVQVAYLPTFGNVVIVRHPKSYLTVYANLGRVSVAKGEIIRSRQLLGFSAAMPEGGSTVHFEVWKGKVKQNPQKWLR
ncbi:murein hydrolase activator EnvC family protein [Chlorobaculum tepidum]|nr:M23 family metallopeptidase [Chlorobaculum tepidum]